MNMKLEDFVCVTLENSDGELVSTHVVLKEKLEVFLNDKYAMYCVSFAYINEAVICLNGSIGKGKYITNYKVNC